jgi:Fe-S cluster assembly protein SufD
MSTPVIERYVGEISALSEQLPGRALPWLQTARNDGLERFETLGFPSTRLESWKYTNVRPIEKRPYRPAAKACMGLDADDLSAFFLEGLHTHRLVFVNGHYAPELSLTGRLPDGVFAGDLARALTEMPRRIEPHLGRIADAGASGFSALNAAAMADGAFVYLGDGRDLQDPIHLLFLSTRQQDSVFTQPRNLIIGEAGSRALVIESYASLGESDHFTNAVTEIALESGSELEHYKLQRECAKAYHVATLQVHQGRDSRFTSHSVALGGRITRNDINSVLDAEGAECVLNGLYMADGRQHVDHHTRVDHVRPRCTSAEFYKGILDGYSRGVFNGRVYVHPDAQKTDASQTNRNLLLSRDAEVDTKPQLEIYADDVRCSHGATVGQLDERMLFYLRSRGIHEATARGMLTYGFAHDMVERMGLAPVRECVEDVLVNRLPVSAAIKG